MDLRTLTGPVLTFPSYPTSIGASGSLALQPVIVSEALVGARVVALRDAYLQLGMDIENPKLDGRTSAGLVQLAGVGGLRRDDVP